MAARKRSSTTRTRRKVNPKRRATATVRSRAAFSPFKRKTTRKRAVRRSNPSGFAGEVMDFSIAGIGLGIMQPVVQPLFARFLPLGAYTSPVAAAASGYGLGWLASKFAPTRRFARPLQILGVSTAIIGIVAPIVRGFLGNSSSAGMGGIAMVTGIPPRIVAPPLPPASQRRAPTNGVSGVSAIPGRSNRW